MSNQGFYLDPTDGDEVAPWSQFEEPELEKDIEKLREKGENKEADALEELKEFMKTRH